MNYIIPSIASADPLHLQNELQKVSFMPSLHLDIEDGNFIPNITFGLKTVEAIAGTWKGGMDAHLMVTNPEAYLEALAGCRVSAVAFHIEAVRYPLEIIHRIHALGLRAGIALNPGTPLDRIVYISDTADYFLLMTVEPDGQGQRFLPNMPDKMSALRSMLSADKEIWADGGIGESEAVTACRNGVNVLIMGRAVFGIESPRAFVEGLSEKINNLSAK